MTNSQIEFKTLKVFLLTIFLGLLSGFIGVSIGEILDKNEFTEYYTKTNDGKTYLTYSKSVDVFKKGNEVTFVKVKSGIFSGFKIIKTGDEIKPEYELPLIKGTITGQKNYDFIKDFNKPNHF